MIDEKILNIAKKYSLKGHVFKIDGPIYYLTAPYWIISYWRKIFFIKSFLEKILIVNENGTIINDQEIFKKISIIKFVPYPSKVHVENFRNELSELEYVYNFFMKKPSNIGMINLTILNKKFKELNCLKAVKLIEEIEEKSKEIANVLEELVNIKREIINMAEKLLSRKDSLLLEKFYEEILNNEKTLFNKLKTLIEERIILIRKFRKIFEKYSKDIVENKKDEKLLIKNLKDDIIALFRFSCYINNKLKLYDMILNRLNEAKQRISNLYFSISKEIE